MYMYGEDFYLLCPCLRKAKEILEGGTVKIALVGPWALVGRALMGRALMGRALVGPWALKGRALMGRALMGGALVGPRALVCQGPYGPRPYGPGPPTRHVPLFGSFIVGLRGCWCALMLVCIHVGLH